MLGGHAVLRGWQACGAALEDLTEDALHLGHRPRCGTDGAECRASSCRRGSAYTSRVVAAMNLSMWATADVGHVASW